MEKTEGIFLNTIDFKDHDLILSAFTRDLGLIKMIFKGGKSRARKKGGSTSPLTQAELVLRKGKGELYTLQEVSVLDSGIKLRDSLESLEEACRLVRAIAATQLPGKSSPLLYQLLVSYLKAIPLVSSKQALSASFILKLLKHEGQFLFEECCALCGIQQEVFYHKKETFCLNHAPKDALKLSTTEKSWLDFLTHSRSLSEIAKLELPTSFTEKIDQMLLFSLA